MRRAAFFGIAVGVMMFAQWGGSLLAGNVPELVTEPIRIAFHLAAEAATAVALIVGGVGLLRRTKWARPVYATATGMLLYTSLVSPGYFAQQGVLAPVGLFALIAVFALINLRTVYGNGSR